MRSGLMTRKSAKYSCTARTTSWSSASASRSSDDFLMMLLKSTQGQLRFIDLVSFDIHTDFVFAILWFPQLFNQVLYRVGRWAYKA